MVSTVFLIALPFVQGIENLNKISTAICLENFVAIIGIIMIVPIFAPEEPQEIDEIVASKCMPLYKPYLTRIIWAFSCILILVTAFCIILKYNLCVFPFAKYIFGTVISAIFLGSIGLFVSSVAVSTIIGYMASIGYLIINMMTGNKFVSMFYLFSMKNNSFREKYYLLAGSAVLIFLSILIKVIRRKL